MAWPLSEDARTQAAKDDAVQLATIIQTQMWAVEEMDGCGKKEPQQ